MIEREAAIKVYNETLGAKGARGKLVVNLPKRMLDVVTRPYPWQIQNTSQQLGAFGSLFLRHRLEAWMMGRAQVYPVLGSLLLPD